MTSGVTSREVQRTALQNSFLVRSAFKAHPHVQALPGDEVPSTPSSSAVCAATTRPAGSCPRPRPGVAGEHQGSSSSGLVLAGQHEAGGLKRTLSCSSSAGPAGELQAASRPGHGWWHPSALEWEHGPVDPRSSPRGTWRVRGRRPCAPAGSAGAGSRTRLL